MIELTKKDDLNYELNFDIQPLADNMGITKQQLAELMADEFMKILGLI